MRSNVFPEVAVRQWVLSLPHRIRYLLAWDHDLCRTIVAVYQRTVLGFLRRRGRRDGVTDGRSGTVAIVQRFGAALSLNVHIHALVRDGAFAKDTAGALRFHPGARLLQDDVAAVVATVDGKPRRAHRPGVASQDQLQKLRQRGVPAAVKCLGLTSRAHAMCRCARPRLRCVEPRPHSGTRDPPE